MPHAARVDALVAAGVRNIAIARAVGCPRAYVSVRKHRRRLGRPESAIRADLARQLEAFVRKFEASVRE